MLLYLIRHAQTASSAIDSFNGQRELPLTPEGRAQAAALGKRLADVKFAAVYRSPLDRTRETAALVAPSFASRLITLPGLIEINYGDWEGPLARRGRSTLTRSLSGMARRSGCERTAQWRDRARCSDACARSARDDPCEPRR